MKRLMVIGLILIVLAIFLITVTQCASGLPTRTTVAPQADSPVETPTEVIEPTATPVIPLNVLSFEGPEILEVGEIDFIEITLVGGQQVDTLMLEALLPILYLQVIDANPEMSGIQVMPGPLPQGAQVTENLVDGSGRLRYRVEGLGGSDEIMRSVAAFPVQALVPALAEVAFSNAQLLRADGIEEGVVLNTLLLNIVEGAAPPPTPTPLPTATPTPLPTESPTPAPTPVPSSYIASGSYYRLQAGQNLYRVALAFNSTVEAIAAANGLADVNQVPAGTLLRIPVPPPSGQAAYFVGPRENLYSIARTFGVTVERLAGYNNIQPPYNIQAGQWIVLVP